MDAIELQIKQDENAKYNCAETLQIAFSTKFSNIEELLQ